MRNLFKCIALALTVCLVLPGCAKAPVGQEEVTAVPTNVQLGNQDTTDQGDNYSDTKPSGVETQEPTMLSPTSYASAADIPEGYYAIEHRAADGTVTYQRPYHAWGGIKKYRYNEETRQQEEYFESDPFGGFYYPRTLYGSWTSHFTWVIDSFDEPIIPTMYAGDKFIFRSENAVVSEFQLERFEDAGYTIGLSGLQKTDSGNYMYVTGKSYAHPDSDTANIEMLGASEIYVVAVGDNRVTEENVSKTGFITGLTKDMNYTCDIRTGTKKSAAAFRANVHVFVSMEQYNINKFYFSGSEYIEVALPDTMPTGYYSVNGFGIFRYIAAEDIEREAELTAEDYNIPFFVYDEDENIIATRDGYSFDENACITETKDIVVIDNNDNIDQNNPE